MRDAWLEAAPFMLPLLLLIGIFVLVPVLGTILTSFFRDVTFLPTKWTGIDNFQALATDASFGQSFRFTMFFILVSVPLEIICGMAVALLLNTASPFRGWLRAGVLIPWAIPAAVSARVWELIYAYNYGLANWIIQKIGLVDDPVNWLGTGIGAFFAVVLADVWKTTPFVAIILLSGLSAIPETLYKQAHIDGTHFVQRFFLITIPLLRPVLVVALLFRTIDALRIFDLLYVLTSGGPGGETTSLSLYAYRLFVGGDFGMGSAVSVFLFFSALALSVLLVRIGKFGNETV